MQTSQSLWGQLRSLAQRTAPIWFAEVLQLIAQLPAHEQDVAVAYVVKARGLREGWGRWELELQSVFELFLDAPLESFDRAHVYRLYLKVDEVVCRRVAMQMGLNIEDPAVPSPTLTEVVEHVLAANEFDGEHPSSGYLISDTGHLVFTPYARAEFDVLRRQCLGYSSSSIWALEDVVGGSGEVPFFYCYEGECLWWPSFDVLWRCDSDGTLFDALFRAFQLDCFKQQDAPQYPLCAMAQYEVAHELFDPITGWSSAVNDQALRAHLDLYLGQRYGPWEAQCHHLNLGGDFGYPQGNGGCALRVSGHWSLRWPSTCGPDGDGLADFAYGGGLERLRSYVKGVVSWVYASHGNARYGGMCIVEGTSGLDEEVRGFYGEG